jgi:hypothetical protein
MPPSKAQQLAGRRPGERDHPDEWPHKRALASDTVNLDLNALCAKALAGVSPLFVRSDVLPLILTCIERVFSNCTVAKKLTKPAKPLLHKFPGAIPLSARSRPKTAIHLLILLLYIFIEFDPSCLLDIGDWSS